MKWRNEPEPNDAYDQVKLFDPYEHDCTAEGYVEEPREYHGDYAIDGGLALHAQLDTINDDPLMEAA